MNYNKITTYYDFVQYCLHRLGAPVVNIEVHDTQIIDRVTDALQFYLEQDTEALRETYWLYTCTEEDENNHYIQMTPDVLDVLEILPSRRSMGTPQLDYMDDPEYQFWQGYFNFGAAMNTNLIFYELTMQQMSTIRQVLEPTIAFDYRMRERKIYPYKQIKAGNVICIYGYKTLDPETDECIWDASFLKEYCTALIGCQWGTNLSKFGNVPGAGGVSLNGDAILQKYTEEKNALEEKFKLQNIELPQLMWG